MLDVEGLCDGQFDGFSFRKIRLLMNENIFHVVDF